MKLFSRSFITDIVLPISGSLKNGKIERYYKLKIPEICVWARELNVFSKTLIFSQ